MLMQSRHAFLKTFAALPFVLAGLTPTGAAADQWPTQPIKLIVSSAAGGGADSVARLIGQHISTATKQPVIVENRAGASGVLAANAVLAAPADGNTFLFGFTTMAQLPATSVTPLPFNVERDFIPVSLVAKSSNVLVVSRAAGVTNVAQLFAAAKKDPKSFSYGSYGNGSTGHFLGAQFADIAQSDLAHIPYKGAAPMMNDILGGVLPFGFPDVGSAAPHLNSDRVRLLAVTGDKRLPSLPQVPTMEELGYKGFNLGAWFGVFAPRGTPAVAVNGLSARIAAAVADPEVQVKLKGWNLDPVGSKADSFAKFFSADLKGWSDVARKANIRAE
ncbi:MAG: hypothetical protein ACD_23C00404G0003 [uncultured bacterium]|nr:MAG: hypothetical protein ACD_23C00404G0003 [uncultured bacterium]